MIRLKIHPILSIGTILTIVAIVLIIHIYLYQPIVTTNPTIPIVRSQTPSNQEQIASIPIIPIIPINPKDQIVKLVKDEPPQRTPPNEGIIYVWPTPEYGHQSIVVLSVLDGNDLEAAYLIPIRLRLNGAISPQLDKIGGKEAKEALEKLLLGSLRTAQLFGQTNDGCVLADFWLIKDEKKPKDGVWASSLMLKRGAKPPPPAPVTK